MRLLPILLLAGLLLSACADGDASVPTPSATSDRVEAILDARRLFGPPAAELGAASAEVATRALDLAAGAATELDRRRDAIAVLRDAIGDLEADADAAASVRRPDTEVADVAGAVAALDAAVAAAREQADAARELTLRTEAFVDAETALAEVVATWDEPGSRNEQVERLGAAAERAATIAEDLRAVPAGPACSTATDRRIAYADAVAAGTRELEELARAGQGTAFDQRRVELREQLPASLADADRGERDCLEEHAEVAQAADRVGRALAELEAALNPEDLAASRVLGTPTGRS